MNYKLSDNVQTAGKYMHARPKGATIQSILNTIVECMCTEN